MDLKSVLSPALTQCHRKEVTSKKQALEQISRLISDIDEQVDYQDILETLQQRERLGSTAIGHGIAIPHARIKNLQYPLCAILTLEKPIHFTNDVNDCVDLIFGLLVPEQANEAHLEILSTLTSKLHDVKFRERLREAKSNQELYEIAVGKINNL